MDSKTETTIESAAKNNLAAAQFAETKAKLLKEGLIGTGDGYRSISDDMDSVTEIAIPNDATKIGRYAYYGCQSLSEISIPKNITEIGDWAFADCRELETLNINGPISVIGVSAFKGHHIHEIVIPKVDLINAQAFFTQSPKMGVSYGECVIDIKSVREISTFAFAYANGYSDVYITVNLQSNSIINSKAFNMYKSSHVVVDIYMPNDGTVVINKEAFSVGNPGTHFVSFRTLSKDEIVSYDGYPFGFPSGISMWDKNGTRWNVGKETI